MKLFKSKKDVSLPLHIDVGCAVVRQGRKILITRRPKSSHLGGLWEFPGGKRLGGESLQTCLERELLEELLVRIRVGRFLKRVDYRYPKKDVSLYFYECALVEGVPFPRGCAEIRWVWPFELRNYPFPPADETFLKELQRI